MEAANVFGPLTTADKLKRRDLLTFMRKIKPQDKIKVLMGKKCKALNSKVIKCSTGDSVSDSSVIVKHSETGKILYSKNIFYIFDKENKVTPYFFTSLF